MSKTILFDQIKQFICSEKTNCQFQQIIWNCNILIVSVIREPFFNTRLFDQKTQFILSETNLIAAVVQLTVVQKLII